MRIHTDKRTRRLWLWLNDSDNICFEIGRIPSWELGFNLELDTEDITLGLYLFLLNFYISLDFKKIVKFLQKHPNHFFKKTWEKGSPQGSYWEERNVGIRLDFADKTFSGEFWTDMNNYPSKRHFYIFLDDLLLGRAKHTLKILDEGEAMIDMPEGGYPTTYKIEARTWKRPRWPFSTKRTNIYFEIPIGIPHEGKGENSWDMGMNATFGIGTEWKGDLHNAVRKIAIRCLEQRQKYGSLSSPDYAKWRKEKLKKHGKKTLAKKGR